MIAKGGLISRGVHFVFLFCLTVFSSFNLNLIFIYLPEIQKMVETEKNADNNDSSKNKVNARYTAVEDLAIINYMITDNRYLNASGIQVWRDAEKQKICPNRPYLSMKERFRKVIVKNLKQYNIEKDIAIKITQFMRANQKGKRLIRYQQTA